MNISGFHNEIVGNSAEIVGCANFTTSTLPVEIVGCAAKGLKPLKTQCRKADACKICRVSKSYQWSGVAVQREGANSAVILTT
ncbi:hypothetical protein TNCV_5075951 [Trichonephila clavipes]|uniref:Uncharacterized protein n=1 Tax=Trichonephila clavipes TaxID=2585209 RepID=A0A8X6S612_TRICX|nr:hypothetical protein TNCV_5075951 [Trichonephila clavipes]